MLVDLSKLSNSCVFAIVDKYSGKAHVNYSISVVGMLPRLWEECSRAGTTLEFRTLSVTTDIETLKLHTEYWRDRYEALLPRGRKTLQYDVRCFVDGDYDGVDVTLVTARGVRKIVGRFNGMEEAQEFKRTYYADDNPYHFPVYATNCRTRQFLLDLGMEKNIITI